MDSTTRKTSSMSMSRLIATPRQTVSIRVVAKSVADRKRNSSGCERYCFVFSWHRKWDKTSENKATKLASRLSKTAAKLQNSTSWMWNSSECNRSCEEYVWVLLCISFSLDSSLIGLMVWALLSFHNDKRQVSGTCGIRPFAWINEVSPNVLDYKLL